MGLVCYSRGSLDTRRRSYYSRKSRALLRCELDWRLDYARADFVIDNVGVFCVDSEVDMRGFTQILEGLVKP